MTYMKSSNLINEIKFFVPECDKMIDSGISLPRILTIAAENAMMNYELHNNRHSDFGELTQNIRQALKDLHNVGWFVFDEE